MLAHFLPALCASVFAAAGCQQDNPTGIRSRTQAAVAPQQETSLAPVADTYIRQGRPNQNQGAEPTLRLESLLKNRALLRWDQAALTQAVAGGTLASARLELTIADLRDNWSAAGRPIELHRMTQAWTELGATWNCAVDIAPGSMRANCGRLTAWDMDHASLYPWVATPTATALLKNGQTGVVSFDVTADVRAWLGGQQPNYGWILKKTAEGYPGKVDFGSRESGAGPRLVLELAVQGATWPLLTDTYPELDTSRVVRLSADSALAYLRTDIVLRFKTGISDSAKAAYFARNALQVLGVTRSGQFFVRMPDPGATLREFHDALDRLEADAIILLAAPITRQPLPQSDFLRLPSDGAGQRRSDWSSNSSGTWAMRAIRAPLAWGCETGEYGAAPVRVGIFEWKHEPLHPEFASSSPRPWQPGDADLHKYTPVPAETVAAKREHATSTVGLLSAQGDNASGLAGMNWRTDLYLYAGYSPQNRPLDVYTGFYLLAQAIAADGVRVLSLSANAEIPDTTPPEDRERLINSVMEDVKFWLFSNSPNLLVVVAAGNERFSGDVKDYPAGHRVALVRAALLRLAEDAKYRGQIIVVTRTAAGNQFWSGGNFFAHRATDLAAPAENVAVLGPWHNEVGAGVPLTVKTGTSLSAPLVAGVAAPLLAMDPTLSADQVKDYILRGASAARISSRTGDSVPAQPVRGVPNNEVIYQLDAYGALSLLSRERPGTPICGFPVSVTPDQSSIVLERPGARAILAVPGLWIGALSVAQGGRLISVGNADPETYTGRSVIMDQTGRILSVVPDTQRTYLERDTLDSAWDYSLGLTSYTLRRAAGGPPQHLQPLSRIPLLPADSCDGYSWLSFSWLAFSPSGDWVAVGVRRCALQGRPVQLWLIPTDRAGVPHLVETYAPESQDEFEWSMPSAIEWSHDSRRVIYFTDRERPWGSPGVTLLVTSVGADSAVHDATLPNVSVWSQTFSADDSSVVALEYPDWMNGSPVCTESRHDPATWATFPGSHDVGPCFDNNWYRNFPNAPPVRSGASRGAPAASVSAGRTAGGFGLGAPAADLEGRARAARGLFPTTLRVQVN